MPPPATSAHRLLVEGPDDRHTICNLAKRHGLNWDAADTRLPYVSTHNGADDLLSVLGIEIRGRLRALGVVIDADADLQRRWTQIKQVAEREGVSLPDQPVPSGTIVTSRRGLRLGAWVMPDNKLNGTLELFLATLVPAGDSCWPVAQEAVRTALRAGCGREQDVAKHALYTWLAWKDPPGRPFGAALTAHMLGKDSAEALAFMRWLCDLYGL